MLAAIATDRAHKETWKACAADIQLDSLTCQQPGVIRPKLSD